MVRIVCLTALSFVLLAGAARAAEEDLLALREGASGVAPLPTNQFTPSAAAKNPAAHFRDAVEARPSCPSEALAAAETQFFSWKNACPMDRVKRNGFSGLRPYVAKKKTGDDGFLKYFMSNETP